MSLWTRGAALLMFAHYSDSLPDDREDRLLRARLSVRPNTRHRAATEGSGPVTVLCEPQKIAISTPLEIFGAQPGVFGDATEYPAAQILAVVEGELIIGPAFARQESVGSGLSLEAPSDAFQRRQNAPGLVAGQLHTEHPERNVQR